MTRRLKPFVSYFFFLFFVIVIKPVDAYVAVPQQDGASIEQSNYYYSKALTYRMRESRLALNYIDSALALVTDEVPATRQINFWHLKGHLHLQSKEYSAASIAYQKAYEIALQYEDDRQIFISALELAFIYEVTGDYLLAEKYLGQSLTRIAQVHDPLLKAKALRAAAKLSEYELEPETAMQHWGMVEQLSQQAGDLAGVIEAGTETGRILLETGQPQQALIILNLSLADAQKNGDLAMVVRIYELIADSYLAQLQVELALQALEAALTTLEDEDRNPAKVQVLIQIAELHYEQADLKSARQLLITASQLSALQLDPHAQAHTHRLLAKLCEETGDHAQALFHYQMQANLTTSILEEANTRQVHSLQSDFNLERKQQEIEYLRKEKELLQAQTDIARLEAYSSRILLAMLGVMMLLLSILFWMFRRRNLARKHAKQQLERYVDEIQEKNKEIRAKSVLINDKNAALEEAHHTIASQNLRLRDSNVRLEEMVSERTEELIKAYKKLSIHTNHAPLAVMEWDRDGQLIRWSKQAERMFGYSSEEVLGRHYEELALTYEDDLTDQQQVMASLTSGKIKTNFSKLRNYTKDKSLLHVEWSNSILFDKEGNIDTILSIANDVSDREKALVELKVINKELDDFIYKASHDLQGPVARMQGVINLGLIECKEQVARRYFRMLEGVTGEMADLLNKLQRVHTIYEQEPRMERINLRESILETTGRFTNLVVARELEVYVEADPDLHWQIDPKLFDLIIGNMMDNALLYREKRNALVIFRVETMVSGLLKICVIDNGIGIPPQASDRIFDIFYQGTPKSISSGLGLYLVKKAIERMGGRIRLINPSKDTIFEMIIPSFA